MVNDSKILRGLNGTALFKNLPDEVLINISKKAGLEVYNPEDIIVSEGEPSDRLFIIINGIVTVKKVIPNQPDKVFAYLLPGSTFGEVGILENKPRSATVQAMTNVEVLIFERNYFLSMLHEYPSAAIELAKLLGHYLTESNKRLSRGDKDKKVVLVLICLIRTELLSWARDCRSG
jgi:CRP-like cAMP-binding protein